MKTLIIGGGGFIGQWVAQRLSQKGREVMIMDRRPASEIELPAGVLYFQANLSEGDSWPDWIPDEIIDLAYASVPKTSFDEPIYDIVSNLPIFVKVLQYALRINCKKIIFFSSGGAVYGQAQYLPIDEKHPLNPISPYGITKQSSEKYAYMFHSLYGLPVVCLRPGNAYGEGQIPFRGQGFIATLIASVIENRKIIIFGQDGTIRDYIHVDDIANAVVSALDRGKSGEIYNIGSGVGYNNRQVIDEIRNIMPREIEFPQVEVMPGRKFDVNANILNCDKFYRDTGWKPLIGFQEGLTRSVQYYLKNHGKSL